MNAYQSIRDQIKTGDLIEWSSDSILGKAIRTVTRKNVNHSSMAIWMRPEYSSKHDVRNCSTHRLYVMEAIGNGLRPTFMSSKLEKFKGECYWSSLVDPDIGPRLSIEMQKIEGRGYDWVSLVRNLWCRVPLDPKNLYCSEAIQWSCLRAGALSPEYSPTGKPKHKLCGLRPGELVATGIWYKPVRIL